MAQLVTRQLRPDGGAPSAGGARRQAAGHGQSSPSARPPLVGQVLGPGLLLLGPAGVDLAGRALDATTRLLQRDGIGASPQLRELAALVQQARSDCRTGHHAGGGTTEPCQDRDGAACQAKELLDVAEVATLLACSQGFTRRLCRTGALESARRVGGRWQVDRIEVEALRDHRAPPGRPA